MIYTYICCLFVFTFPSILNSQEGSQASIYQSDLGSKSLEYNPNNPYNIRKREREYLFNTPPEYSSPGEVKAYHIVLEPINRTRFYPQLQAISPVTTLNVKEGDSFKKGDLLIQLDPGKYEAYYYKTKAALAKSQEEFRAKERLFKDGTGSYVDYIESKSNLVAAQAEVVFAEKNLEAITFIAPYDGKVASLSIDKYEVPLENKDMAEIINDRVLVGKVLLPSNLIKQVHVGDPIEIMLDEYSEPIEASISRVGASIEPSSSTFKIEVDLDNAEGKLIPGMSGNVTLK